jgi:LmbE family N-acetylglucosaminyl deacetylase
MTNTTKLPLKRIHNNSEHAEDYHLNGKIAVFAPHPDDETFGCGGTIAKKISEGYEILVVILTDGRHAFSKVLGIFSDPSPEELRVIRQRELINATKILGVPEKNLIWLGFEDGCLEKYEKEAEEKVLEILRENKPKEIYFPHKRDAHPDHRATNRIVGRCILRLGLKSVSYQYSVVHQHSRMGPMLEGVLHLFKNNRTKVDISGYVDIKEKATREYKSEIAVVSVQQRKPVNEKVERYLKNEEVFYGDT